MSGATMDNPVSSINVKYHQQFWITTNGVTRHIHGPSMNGHLDYSLNLTIHGPSMDQHSASPPLSKYPWMPEFLCHADLIGHIKFLPWRQLDGCSVTRPFLSAKGVACKTSKRVG